MVHEAVEVQALSDGRILLGRVPERALFTAEMLHKANPKHLEVSDGELCIYAANGRALYRLAAMDLASMTYEGTLLGSTVKDDGR